MKRQRNAQEGHSSPAVSKVLDAPHPTPHTPPPPAPPCPSRSSLPDGSCLASLSPGSISSCCHCLVAQSCPTLCNTVDCNTPYSSVHGFPRQEYWSGLPFPSPGDRPNPGIEPMSPALQVDSLPLSYQGSLELAVSEHNP